MLENSENPMKMLEEDQANILKIIGDQNSDCIKMFKYIVNCSNTTPINSVQSNNKAHHNYTPSTQYSNNMGEHSNIYLNSNGKV